MFSYLWLHAGVVHLLGNMLFLWVFGNAVCARIGNPLYALLYLAFGVIAGVAHLAFNGQPALGASGAVNGIVGMYVVFYPLNNITCLYLFIIRFGRFALSGVWIILLWLAFDILGAAVGSGGVAYWAHLGGFFTGFAVAALLIGGGLVRMATYEKSLLAFVGLEKKEVDADASDRPAGSLSARSNALDRPSVENHQPDSRATEGRFIRFQCTCGKQLKARPEQVGRTVRCPVCSQCLRIPHGDSRSPG